MALGGRKPSKEAQMRQYFRTADRARRYRYKGAQIKICSIHTDRFREMTARQLRTAQTRIGDVPQAERMTVYSSTAGGKKRTARALLNNFLFELGGCHEYAKRKDDPEADATYRRKFNEEPVPASRIRASFCAAADRAEQNIWNMQERAGCKISGDEQVARDAQRAGRRGVANRIRRQNYRPHHKRR